MGNVETCGPNEALVLSGGCGSDNVQTIVGGWGWAWCGLTDVQRIPLSIMTLCPRCEDVETSEGVPVTVTGVAQVKVMQDKKLLAAACEQFLGLDVETMQSAILHTMEGHLRAILGTLSIESIYRDREMFASLVREMVAPDIGGMGIEILSFTIKDLSDKVEYLNSLGRGQTANVRRDADIGVAEAERDAVIREADYNKQMVDVRCEADGAIADSQRKFELLQTHYNQEVNMANAESTLAYKLQAAKEQQLIMAEEMEIEVVERRKRVEIEEQEIIRNEKKLESTIRLPAEAEGYRVQTIAQGQRTKTVLEARASAEGIRVVGAAKAVSLEATGTAEAEGLVKMAEAFNEFTDAAKLKIVLESLPNLAAELTAPLSRTREIVILGGNDAVNGSTSLAEMTDNVVSMFSRAQEITKSQVGSRVAAS